MKVYYDKDADLSIIKGMKVTIVGYGSQGHAHAQNLKDSGVKVTVGLRKDGASWKKAEAAGHKVEEIAKAVKGADVVMILLPDESMPAIYEADVAPHLKKGAALAFAEVKVKATLTTSPFLRQSFPKLLFHPVQRCAEIYRAELLVRSKPIIGHSLGLLPFFLTQPRSPTICAGRLNARVDLCRDCFVLVSHDNIFV